MTFLEILQGKICLMRNTFRFLANSNNNADMSFRYGQETSVVAPLLENRFPVIEVYHGLQYVTCTSTHISISTYRNPRFLRLNAWPGTSEIRLCPNFLKTKKTQ